MSFYYDPEKKALIPQGEYSKAFAVAGSVAAGVAIASGPIGLIAGPGGLIAGSGLGLAMSAIIATKAVKALRDFTKPGKLTKEDTDNIIDVLVAGRENNVSELELELDRKVVQGLDMDAIEALGLDFTLGQKGSSRYKLKVKYK